MCDDSIIALNLMVLMLRQKTEEGISSAPTAGRFMQSRVEKDTRSTQAFETNANF